GNQRIIDRGMKLLTLVMINDHVHDSDVDYKQMKLNPVGDGHWNAEEIMNTLRKALYGAPCPEMDGIIDPENPPVFWDI
ncbi:MAG: hypothetical protein KAJ98_07065, partial [Spirochaetaceae bacterium]|nr:hypothetical protein [Spirochaetaceae bacterium]